MKKKVNLHKRGNSYQSGHPLRQPEIFSRYSPLPTIDALCVSISETPALIIGDKTNVQTPPNLAPPQVIYLNIRLRNFTLALVLLTLLSGGAAQATDYTINTWGDLPSYIFDNDLLYFVNTSPLTFGSEIRNGGFADKDGINLTGNDPDRNKLTKNGTFSFLSFGNGFVNGGISNLSFDGTGTGAVSTDGGALWVQSYFSGSINNCSFTGNAADYSGGALYVQNNFTGSINDSEFNGNRANSGGAVEANDFIGDITDSQFRNNTAMSGGAVRVDDFIGNIRGSTFDGNSAHHGGAVGASYFFGAGGTGSYSDMSGTEFLNNEAASEGGALYIARDTYISAKDGNLTFRGNKKNSATTNDPNAIYVDNDGGNNIFALGAGEGKTIFFYDPIESNDYYKNLTIKINDNTVLDTNGDPLFTGTVLFDATDNPNVSDVYGSTTVYGGTLKLANGAVY
ncbi:MAG: hypothetical protein LBU65_14625, partial [Planctomycetaceae bacterium]|nr:hypothetical protein [Planctomycetaceae bacterium]